MRDTFLLVRYADDSPEVGLILTADFREEGENWLAECIETGTPAYAPSLKEARDELMGAVTLQLDEIEKLGCIKEFLSERGVKVAYFPGRKRRRRTSGPTWTSAEQGPPDLVHA